MGNVLVHVLVFVLGIAQEPSARIPETPRNAQDSIVAARTKAIASDLRCPVCQGLSIQDSPSPLAQEMRNVIADQVRAGKTDEEVVAYFVDKYDEWILLEPKASGFNLAVYILPVVMLLGGAGFVWYLTRKWTRPRGTTAESENVNENENVTTV